ncbi:hypothetical protein ACFX13_016585 [Malus domestica]
MQYEPVGMQTMSFLFGLVCHIPYVYLIPAFALDPSAHCERERERENVLASLGSDQEFVKCLECFERGLKVGGLICKSTYELRGTSFELGILSNGNESNRPWSNLKLVKKLSNEEIEVLPENGGGDNNSNSELEDEITVSSGSNAVSEIEIENDRVVPEEAEAADLNSESLNVRMLVLVKRRLMKKTRQRRGSGKGNGLCYGDKERKMGFVMVKEEGKGKV